MTEHLVGNKSWTTLHPGPLFQEARDSQRSRRRKIMKRALTSVGFVMAFVSLLVLGLVSRVQAEECSDVSIKGTYGFSCEGTVVGVGPIAVIGVFTADGMAMVPKLKL